MITEQQFKGAAALLKRHAPPDVWENFIGAFAAYTFMKIGEVTDAPLDIVVLAQGQARMAKQFNRMLTECEPKPPRGTP